MNEDKSKGTVIEGHGWYVSVMIICILFTEGMIWASLHYGAEGVIIHIIVKVIFLASYWLFFRTIIHRAVDEVYNKITERTDLTKFRTVDCMKLKGDLTLKYYSYVLSVVFLLSVLMMAKIN